jgi:hypothetical protein
MSTQVDPSHNINALLLGTGEFRFSKDASSAANAQARGYTDFGNIVAFTVEPDNTAEEHVGSYRGTRRVDKRVVTQTKIQYKLRCDEWNLENIRLVFAGSDSTPHTQAALTAGAGESLAFGTTAAVIGKWYDLKTLAGLRLRNLTSAMIAVSAPIAAQGAATGDTVTKTSHGLANGTPVLITGAALAAPLVTGTVYYVRDTAANTFKLALTLGGVAIDLTTDGTDTNYQALKAEGTDYELDLLQSAVRFLTAQAATVVPILTCSAIAAGDEGYRYGLIPGINPTQSGYGKLVVFDQYALNKVVMDHDAFSCDLSIDSTSEVDGTGFTDMTMTILVTTDPGTLFVRQANQNDAVSP